MDVAVVLIGVVGGMLVALPSQLQVVKTDEVESNCPQRCCAVTH